MEGPDSTVPQSPDPWDSALATGKTVWGLLLASRVSGVSSPDHHLWDLVQPR